VENNEFVVHYQPTFEIATGLPIGVEALVRWAQPGGPLVPPMEFIPVAEQSTVIHALTRNVLDTSVRQCRAWLDRGWRLPVAVNVSASCFLDRSFADNVQATLRHHRVAPELLTLEITETTIVSDPDRVRAQLAMLRLAGVSVALDDVGVGSSTLSNLKTLPIDELKIDRSLVSNMTTNAHDAALVRAVLDIGRGLDLRVVAEGAEDSETCDALMAMGCLFAQGFQWLRPMPAEELNLFLVTAMERVQLASDAKP
jgi:diguanylate cyclase